MASLHSSSLYFFFFIDTATTEIYTLSLHDALPISPFRQALEHASQPLPGNRYVCLGAQPQSVAQAHYDYVRRSEEHTSELQSQSNLVCRLLLEKKKKNKTKTKSILNNNARCTLLIQ